MHRAVLFVGTLKTLYKDYRYCPIKNVVKAVDAKSLCHKPSKDGERILMSYLASNQCPAMKYVIVLCGNHIKSALLCFNV